MDDKINILIVDDKPEKVLSLEVVLGDLGQNIVRAYSGREALRCLLNQSFAVILLDVNMPVMDGFETASLIRKRAATEGVPIIFVTAMDDDTHVSRGYSLGAVDYIHTPVVPEVLKTKVAVFVDLFRKSEQVRLQAESLRRHATQLHRLTAASLAIHSSSTIEEMFGVVTATAREITGASRAQAIFLRGPTDDRANVFRFDSESEDVRQIDAYRPDSLGLHMAVRATNKPIRMSQKELEGHPARHSDAGLQQAAGGWLAAPLLARDGRNFGLIEVFANPAGDFTEEDEAVLVQLAQMGSIAIENTLYAAERETNRIKNEFLSTLSHELRTPLNAILGWTQLLQMEPQTPDVSHGLEVIDRNARAQTKLIEDLLDVSRITTGKLVLNRKPTVLGPVILAAVDAIRPAVEAKKIAVDCKLSAADAVVDADADRLQQVFWNLLSNAVKFTAESGRIEVRLEQQENSVVLSVTDTGRGISRTFLPHVFDRFRQADSTSTRSQGGLGIGLTIVRHIVQLHGGQVAADSAGEGRGSTFKVTLPLAPVKAPARPTLAAPKSVSGPDDVSTDLSGVQILVVDDEADAREVIAAALARSGAAVTTAASVDQALAAVSTSRPDVVISDIAMPGKDGYDLIRLLRDLPAAEGGDTPAVALTAYAREEDQHRALAAGFQHHLAKPVNPVNLIRIIAQLKTSANSRSLEPVARIGAKAVAS